MRVVGILIVILGIGAMAAAGLLARADLSDIRARREAIVKFEAELEQTQNDLYETNILFRGLQKSVPELPDSTKMAQAGVISSKYNVYNKKLRKLQITQKEQTRLLARNRTKIGERKGNIYRKSGPLAAASLLFLGFGAFAIRRAS